MWAGLLVEPAPPSTLVEVRTLAWYERGQNDRLPVLVVDLLAPIVLVNRTPTPFLRGSDDGDAPTTVSFCGSFSFLRHFVCGKFFRPNFFFPRVLCSRTSTETQTATQRATRIQSNNEQTRVGNSSASRRRRYLVQSSTGQRGEPNGQRGANPQRYPYPPKGQSHKSCDFAER